jgi:ribose transport system substrate-binding protein
MRQRSSRGYPLLGVLLITAGLAVAGCGSSGTSHNSSNGSSTAAATGSGGGSTSAGVDVAGAKQDLQAIVGGPKTISLPKLGAAIPKDKTVTYTNCPLEICAEVSQGVVQAAAALGWHTREIALTDTPANYKESWQQIVQNPGSGIAYLPILPDATITPDLSQMKKAGVPVVAITDPNNPIPGVSAVIDSPSNLARQGEAEADWVIQDAGKPVKTVFVYDPSFVSIAAAYNGYHQGLTKYCPKCSATVLKVNAAQIGPALAQQVVSYLQSNPDVGYVVFGLGDYATGVPAALRSAGIANQVKVVVRGATTTNLADLKSGGIAAAFTDETYEAGWRAVDAILRAMVKKPFNPTPPGKIYLLTHSNVPSNISVPYTTPGYQEDFKRAWGLS